MPLTRALGLRKDQVGSAHLLKTEFIGTTNAKAIKSYSTVTAQGTPEAEGVD